MAANSSILAWKIPRTEEPGSYSREGHRASDVTHWLSRDILDNICLSDMSFADIFSWFLVYLFILFIMSFTEKEKKLILPALSPALSQGSALKDVQGDLRVTFLFAFKCAHARQESGSFHREEHMSMCLSPARLHGGLCQSSQTHSPESYFTKALTAPSLIA